MPPCRSERCAGPLPPAGWLHHAVHKSLARLFPPADNGFEFLLHAVVCCSVFCTATALGRMHYFGETACTTSVGLHALI